MALQCSFPLLLLLLLCGASSASATVVADIDYGGVPLWINRLLGEPSVLSLHGRMDPAWFRANNPLACPQECDCPIQWPTALYCDHRRLAEIPGSLPARTEYLFLQVGTTQTWVLSVCCLYNGLPPFLSGFYVSCSHCSQSSIADHHYTTLNQRKMYSSLRKGTTLTT